MPADLDHPVLRSMSGVENRRLPTDLPIGPRAIAILLFVLSVYGAVVFAIVASLGGAPGLID